MRLGHECRAIREASFGLSTEPSVDGVHRKPVVIHQQHCVTLRRRSLLSISGSGPMRTSNSRADAFDFRLDRENWKLDSSRTMPPQVLGSTRRHARREIMVAEICCHTPSEWQVPYSAAVFCMRRSPGERSLVLERSMREVEVEPAAAPDRKFRSG